jgi:GH24 family phage-related lysozyme (muramidase)
MIDSPSSYRSAKYAYLFHASDTDATGHPTVGYGHLCSNSKCSDVKYKIPLSQADGKKLLADDMKVLTVFSFVSQLPEECHHIHTNQPLLKKFEKCITQMCKATLNLNQYGALISWSFNMGCGAAQGSQLIKRLNAGESPNTVIAQELPKWVHDGNGNVLKGLVTRRNKEIALAKTPTDDKALPAKGC